MIVTHSSLSPSRLLALLLMWPVPVSAMRQDAAVRPDTVLGRVIGLDSVALPQVAIHVLSLPDSQSKTTVTGAHGQFAVVFARQFDRYVVTASLIGYKPETLFIHRRTGESDLNVRHGVDVDILLHPAARMLRRT